MRTLLACIATFILCVVLMSMRSAGGPPPAAQPATRWEYALLTQRANGQVSVITPVKYIDGKSWPDLIKNYAHQDIPLAGSRDMAGVLGDDGWELVSVTVTATPSGAMWFKRPVRR